LHFRAVRLLLAMPCSWCAVRADGHVLGHLKASRCGSSHCCCYITFLRFRGTRCGYLLWYDLRSQAVPGKPVGTGSPSASYWQLLQLALAHGPTEIAGASIV
jgi:hypothetical protein